MSAPWRSSPWYFLPGGHVETGESVEAALIRELGQEDHLEFCWIPMNDLPETALRPEPLKAGVQQWAENRVPFWRSLSV